MNTTLQLTEVEAIYSELTAINLQITSNQSVHSLIDLSGQLAAWLAFTGEQMAICKKIWRAATAKAYDSYVFSKLAHDISISPSMANKYAGAKSGDEEAQYEFCERVNRAIVHTIDLLRTCISALKAEQQAYSYGGGTI
ncbi:hypothetical protein [Chitinophaga nivalis]|uniref:Uncharacterized protein n=1 Tax=Chitinophaga nivalis TaxID=2991709 RepID=A0ABT3III1_9BACT|nr:hypothetical protein [Chitinophaga nivalis]MCW3466529.1 hypothetical protein [Chitinophaga nivalis]MCW3483780.1 hypothetical protein [Chitinophaga nivalis]